MITAKTSVQADVQLIVHAYGASEDVTLGRYRDGAGDVDLRRHASLALSPELLKLAATIGTRAAELDDSELGSCLALARTRARLLGPSWSVEERDLYGGGLHIWVPQEGWVPLSGSPQDRFAHAFRLVQTNRQGLAMPYSHVVNVGERVVKFDLLVVVQSAVA